MASLFPSLALLLALLGQAQVAAAMKIWFIDRSVVYNWDPTETYVGNTPLGYPTLTPGTMNPKSVKLQFNGRGVPIRILVGFADGVFRYWDLDANGDPILDSQVDIDGPGTGDAITGIDYLIEDAESQAVNSYWVTRENSGFTQCSTSSCSSTSGSAWFWADVARVSFFMDPKTSPVQTIYAVSDESKHKVYSCDSATEVCTTLQTYGTDIDSVNIPNAIVPEYDENLNLIGFAILEAGNHRAKSCPLTGVGCTLIVGDTSDTTGDPISGSGTDALDGPLGLGVERAYLNGPTVAYWISDAKNNNRLLRCEKGGSCTRKLIVSPLCLRFDLEHVAVTTTTVTTSTATSTTTSSTSTSTVTTSTSTTTTSTTSTFTTTTSTTSTSTVTTSTTSTSSVTTSTTSTSTLTTTTSTTSTATTSTSTTSTSTVTTSTTSTSTVTTSTTSTTSVTTSTTSTSTLTTTTSMTSTATTSTSTTRTSTLTTSATSTSTESTTTTSTSTVTSTTSSSTTVTTTTTATTTTSFSTTTTSTSTTTLIVTTTISETERLAYTCLAGRSTVYKCSRDAGTCDPWLDATALTEMLPSVSNFYPRTLVLDMEANGSPRGMIIGTISGDVFHCDMAPSACQLIGNANAEKVMGLGLIWDANRQVTKYVVAVDSDGAGFMDTTGATTWPGSWLLVTSAFFLVNPESESSDVIACTYRNRVERCPYIVDGSPADCTLLLSGSCSGIQPEYRADGTRTGFVAIFGNQVKSCTDSGDCQVVAGRADGAAGSGLDELKRPQAVSVERVGSRGESAAYWIADIGNNQVKRCEGKSGICEGISNRVRSVVVEPFATSAEATGVAEESLTTASMSAELEVTMSDSDALGESVTPDSDEWLDVEDAFVSATNMEGWSLESVEPADDASGRRLQAGGTYALTFRTNYIVGGAINVPALDSILAGANENFLEAMAEVSEGNWTVLETSYVAIQDDNRSEVVSVGSRPTWASIIGRSTSTAPDLESDAATPMSHPTMAFVFVVAVFFTAGGLIR